MGKFKTTKKNSLFTILLWLLVLAFVVGGISLYRDGKSILGQLGIGGNTQVAPFVVYQGNSETAYEENTAGIEINETETFVVEHLGEDMEIQAKISPAFVANDYNFTLNGLPYSWNADIVEYKYDIGQHMSIEIDQEKNTVTVNGTLGKALQGYALYDAGDINALSMHSTVTADMFCLEISSGGKTMRLNCTFYANPVNIKISENHIILIRC